MYQDPYSPQQPYQPQPGVVPPQQPGAAASPYPYQQASPYPYQQPGAPNPYQQPGPYPAQKFKASQLNPRANRAMINGIISIVLSLLTLVTLAGYAGIITGSFAVVYGFIGLNNAKNLPNYTGRGQAIAGIVMGFIGLFLVIVSFLLRNAING